VRWYTPLPSPGVNSRGTPQIPRPVTFRSQGGYPPWGRAAQEGCALVAGLSQVWAVGCGLWAAGVGCDDL
jgi:hypothetical protein